jgi:zinc protease
VNIIPAAPPIHRSVAPASCSLTFVEYRLDNGLHVILHEDHDTPIVALNIWYHVGSKNEMEGRTGFAHLFEHMMFQGSEHVGPNRHFAFVQEAGGTLNATTSYDRTNYFETLPSHNYELGLWLEADRMRSLAVTQQTLETQRSVVMEERRSRYDNQPYGTMIEQLFSHGFKVQSYRWPVIGSMHDIRDATLADVKAFHEMYYRPSNASLCLAGDFNTAEAAELIALHFGDIRPAEQTPYRPALVEPAQSAPVRDYVFDAVPLAGLIIGFHIPSMTAPEFTALTLLSVLLSSGESSRLHKSLVYERQLAQSVVTYAFELELPGLLLVRAFAQKGARLEHIESIIRSELDAVAEGAVSEEELEKVKNKQETFFVNELSSLQTRADLLNAFHTLSGEAEAVNREISRIRAATREDLVSAAARYLAPENATTLYYLPHPPTETPA